MPKGRCPACARQKERYRGSRHERGYTNAWAKRSKAFLLRYPYCGMRPDNQVPVMSRCYDEGRVTLATQTDHVIPHKGNTKLFNDLEANGQALCAACGGRKSQAGL